MNEKVIDFLQQNARIEKTPPAQPLSPETPASNPS
jgi:hypothetical protein